MRRSFITYVAFLLVAVVFFGGCKSLKKMVQNADKIKYEVKPNPMEMHAQNVDVNITVTFPEKFFLKDAVVVGTPVVKYNGKETLLDSIVVQGEKIQGNGKVVPFETGGTVTYNGKFPYNSEMRVSTLELKLKATRKKKTADIPVNNKLADGIITTPELVQKGLSVDNNLNSGSNFANSIAVNTVLKIENTGNISTGIFYDMQQSNLKASELTKEDMKKLFDAIKAMKTAKDKTLKNVEIYSYASPDGPETMNEKLSKDRSATANKFIEEKFKKEADLKDIKKSLVSQTTAEDWNGFERLMNASSIKDKELILRVLKMYSDPVQREKEIKNISAAFTEIKSSVLPKLRRSDIKVNYEVKVMTEPEILQAALNEPAKLKQEELFYSGQIATSADDKIKVYTNYTVAYPNDWRGFNNLGVMNLMKNDVPSAKVNFEKAKSLEENGTTLNNLGVIAMAEGNMTEAEKYFTDASTRGSSDATNYNLGVINIQKAQYPTAVKFFDQCSNPTFNGSLAKLLTGDNSAALKNINSVVKEDAIVSYLKAIIGAKQENTDLLFTNLRKACETDASLKDYAKKDLEFRKYFEDATFTSIVK